MANPAPRIALWLTLALAPLAATRSPAADPPPGAAPADAPGGDVRAMTVRQLLAEFHAPRDLVSSHSQRRVDLVNALRRLGPPLTDAVRADLADADPGVRKGVLRVLAAVGNRARPLVPEVVAAAGDPDPGVREAAVPVLGHLRDPRGLDALLRAAGDPAPGVRAAVLRTGRAALADAPFALAARALADPDVHVRVAAVQSLFPLKDKRAAAYVAPLLDDETVLHHDVRGGVRTTHRVCDEAVLALEFVVNGTYLLPGDKTQADYDALVRWWRGWREEALPRFDDALYDEPEARRADR